MQTVQLPTDEDVSDVDWDTFCIEWAAWCQEWNEQVEREQAEHGGES